MRVAALSLNHQLRLFQVRFNLHQQQFTALKGRAAQTEFECQTQAAEINRLTTQVNQLKERLGQNSSNSSLPPSTDSPFQKSKNNAASSSGRKHGAQMGHRGRGRWLLDGVEVDRIVELRPRSCTRCGCRGLDQDRMFPARRQVVEITPNGTITTEYQRFALRCLACVRRNRAAWTEEACGGAFGSRTKAVIAYLTGRLHLSHRDAVEAMNELFEIKISLGSIAAVQNKISRALVGPVAQIQHFVEQQVVTYVDETN